MFRSISLSVAIVAFFSFCFAAEAEQISVSWDGGGDGSSWGDAQNWEPNIVPDNDGNTFVVTIDSNSIGVNEVDIGLQQNRTIDQLNCSGDVVLGPWTPFRVQLTLADPNGLTNYGDLVIWCEGLRMQINGNVRNTEWAMLALSRVEIHANLHNLADATLYVWRDTEVKGDLENGGTVWIVTSRGLWVDSNVLNRGQITVYNSDFGTGGIFENDSNGIIRGFGAIATEGLFDNKGAISASGGSLAVSSRGTFLNTGLLENTATSSLHISAGEDINNQGMIQVYPGGSISTGCNLGNEPNAVIKLIGGTFAAHSITHKGGANFDGFGTIATYNLQIDPNASIELTGPTSIVGDVNIASGATFEISDGTTLITGDCTCDNGTIHMIGGRLIPQGGFTNNNCNIIWEPGTYTNVADFNLDGLVNFKDFADFADTWLWQATWY